MAYKSRVDIVGRYSGTDGEVIAVQRIEDELPGVLSPSALRSTPWTWAISARIRGCPLIPALLTSVAELFMDGS